MDSLVPYYPPINREKAISFAQSISKIASLATLDYSQAQTSTMGYLPHQHFVSRFLSRNTPYPSLLLYHVPGSGKSCAAVAFTLYMPREYRLIYVSASPETGSSFLRTIRHTCPHPAGSKLMNDLGGLRRGMVTIMTYIEFARAIHTRPRDFDKCYVVIDEVHNICPSTNTRDTAKIFREAVESGASVNIDRRVSEIYSRILGFIREHTRNKYLFLTGTPIIDDPAGVYYIGQLLEAASGCRELVYTANTSASLLPMMERLGGNGFRKEIFKKTEEHTIDELRTRDAPTRRAELLQRGQDLLTSLYAGKISYLGPKFVITRYNEPTPGLGRKYPLVLQIQGPNTPWGYSNMSKGEWMDEFDLLGPYTYTDMDGFPYKPVLCRMHKRQQQLVHEAEVSPTKHGFFKKQRIYSLLAYDKATDLEYLKANVLSLTEREFADKFGAMWGNLRQLEKVSCIYASVIRDILSHPDQQCFIYFDEFKTAGALLFARILELYSVQGRNFVKYKRGSSSPHPRYTILTSGVQISSLVNNVINAEGNENGEVVSVIIGTRAASEAFSLKGVRTIHIVSPFFNWTRIEQAFSRGVRYDSLTFLPIEQRNVRLFLWAACYSLGRNGQSYISPKRSIHIALYRLMWLKHRRNREVLQVLEDLSVDKVIQELSTKRDVLSRMGGSSDRAGDFEMGDLVMFYLSEGSNLIDSLKNDFSRHSILTLSEIAEKYSRTSLSLLSLTLASMIENKEMIESFYGQPSFLSMLTREGAVDCIYYLSPFDSSSLDGMGSCKEKALMSNYTTNPLFREIRTIHSYLKSILAEHLGLILDELMAYMRSDPRKFMNIISKIQYEETIMFMECVLASGNLRRVATTLLNLNYTPDSTIIKKLLDTANDPLVNENFIEGLYLLLSRFSRHIFTDNSTIYHTLYHYQNIGSGYNISGERLEGNARMLGPSGPWRDNIVGKTFLRKKQITKRAAVGDDEHYILSNFARMVATGLPKTSIPLLVVIGRYLNAKKSNKTGAGKTGKSYNKTVGVILAYIIILSRYPTFEQMIEVTDKKNMKVSYFDLYDSLTDKPSSKLTPESLDAIMNANLRYFKKSDRELYARRRKQVDEEGIPALKEHLRRIAEEHPEEKIKRGNKRAAPLGKLIDIRRTLEVEFPNRPLTDVEFGMVYPFFELSASDRAETIKDLPPHIYPGTGGHNRLLIFVMKYLELIVE